MSATGRRARARRRHRRGRGHRAGRHRGRALGGRPRRRVAIRPVEHLPMDGYRTPLGGEVQEDGRRPSTTTAIPTDYREPVDRLRAQGGRGGASEQCGVAAIGQIPAERWGVVDGHLQRRAAGRRGVVPARRCAGETADPRAAPARPPAGARRGARSGAFGIKGPVLSVNTACAAERQRDRLRRRADPPRPGRRRAHRRRRGAVRRPLSPASTRSSRSRRSRPRPTRATARASRSARAAACSC